MSFSLLDLCQRTDADYALIQRRTDACAQLGRSYELRCTLPDYCTPSEAAVGFCRTADRYSLYLRPRISYKTASPVLSTLLAHGTESFPSFPALTAWLRCLGHELAISKHTLPPLYDELYCALSQQVLSQPNAIEAAAFRISIHLCKRSPMRPLSLILYGPTGTGKSELGKSISPILNKLQPQRKWNCIWTELNTFTQPHSLYRLIGAPPGYVGYEDSPILDAVRHNPYTVFMFDELDKAHPEVLKVFMSILDEGRCSARTEDEHGQREMDFHHCIFIFTTNTDLTCPPHHTIGFHAPTSRITSTETEATDLAHRLFQQDESARRAMVHNGTLREIAARFTGLIGFQPLDNDARRAITVKQISALAREFGLQITSVAPAIIDAITPKDAFSTRSTIAILEGALTPLFAAYSAQNSPVAVQLCGSLQNMMLRTIS